MGHMGKYLGDIMSKLKLVTKTSKERERIKRQMQALRRMKMIKRIGKSKSMAQRLMAIIKDCSRCQMQMDNLIDEMANNQCDTLSTCE